MPLVYGWCVAAYCLVSFRYGQLSQTGDISVDLGESISFL